MITYHFDIVSLFFFFQGVNLGIARRNEQLTLVNGLDFSLQLMHDGMEESHKDERMILQCLK